MRKAKKLNHHCVMTAVALTAALPVSFALRDGSSLLRPLPVMAVVVG